MSPSQTPFDYTIHGQPRRPLSDMYHVLMRGSWVRVLLFASFSYIMTIGVFAVLFFLGGDCVEGTAPGVFMDDFWFSVQTFSTIGYGGMLPKTFYAHVLVTIESFVGLAGVAVVTALMFSRFARPVARVGFSEQAVVCNRNSQPTLQIRMANERQNSLYDVTFRLHVLVEHTTTEGQTMQRLVELELEQPETPIFIMQFTLIHRLDKRSPLHGLTPDNAADRLRFMLASFSGTDDALIQSVYARQRYTTSDLVFGRTFRDMLRRDGTTMRMDYDHLSTLEPKA